MAELLAEDGIQLAFKKQMPALITYLNKNYEALIEIAVGTTETNIKVQKQAFTILLAIAQSYSTNLVNSPVFMEKYNYYIGEFFTETSAVVFSRIFLALLTYSKKCFVVELKNKKEFFLKLLKHSTNASIFSLLTTLVTDRRPIVNAFLEDADCVNQVLEQLCESNQVNIKLLSLLADVVQRVEQDSKLLSPFLNENTTNKLFSMINKKDKQISKQIFRIFNLLLPMCDEDEDGYRTNFYNYIYKFIYEHFDDIVSYIIDSSQFLYDKAEAIKLLSDAITYDQEIKPCIVELIRYLFKNMFEQPNHTILHLSLRMIFDTIASSYPQFLNMVNELQIKKMIGDAFHDHDQHESAYFGILHELGDIILAKNSTTDESDGYWTEFTNDAHYRFEIVSSQPYGGFDPDEMSLFSSDSEDLVVTPRSGFCPANYIGVSFN